MVDPTFGYAFYRRANEKILLVSQFSSKQDRWFEMGCVNIHSGKQYKMVDCTKEKNPPYNVVFPLQFARLLIEYQEHREAKSLAPWHALRGEHQRTVAACPYHRRRVSLRRQGNRSQMGGRRRHQRAGVQDYRVRQTEESSRE
jgi:hypothetical protein